MIIAWSIFGFLVIASILLSFGRTKLVKKGIPAPPSGSTSSDNCHSRPLYPQNDVFQHWGECVNIEPNTGPLPFGFGPVGTEAYQNFFFTTTNSSYAVIAWDCYCAGDAFELFDWRTNATNYSGTLVNITTLQTGGTGAFSNCNVYANDPSTCSTNPAYNKVTGSPSAGAHNLTIVVQRAYYERGVGYIGVYTMCGAKICCNSLVDCSNMNP